MATRAKSKFSTAKNKRGALVKAAGIIKGKSSPSAKRAELKKRFALKKSQKIPADKLAQAAKKK